VKIDVIGAGPAGLYFALLMKKVDRANDVTVWERNAPDATFGWGVVFSEETLGALSDADPESYQEITETFASWGSIDVHYGGETIRSRGHRFSGISRKALLGILQRRCTALGVQLRFHEEIHNVSRFDGADLVVGTDGVNSVVRRAHEDAFRPHLAVHHSKYVWFGTPIAFDAFTFIFRETEHGMFQVHAYPFDASTSTFIVETSEATWERAGLDRMTEQESIAFCQKLFEPELGGRPLMSNRSLWISFGTLTCETWHHGNVALLGDAAHTAHFTIGSGTKLAMEDSVSLASAFLRGRNVPAALVEYEMERQPVVERFQEAANVSASYFENVSRYRTFEPVQFAFNLLTRSGRITHLELERRDPALVGRVDRWFAGGSSVIPSPPMLAPFELGGLRLANRVAGLDVAEGVGLALTGFVAVSAEGRITPETPTIGEVRPAAVPTMVQLGHAGPRGATRPRAEGIDVPLAEGGWPLLAASSVPYSTRAATPREMSPQDMDAVRDAFVHAVENAVGFDALELDMARGYLLASFLSPLTNRRADEFGGSLENRLRYPLNVLDAVRSRWAGPLVVGITATDLHPNGATVAEGVEVAKAMRDHGCDMVHVTAGQTVWNDRPVYGPMYLAPYADRIRNEAGVPVMVGGNLATADEINTILAAGRADLCVLDSRVYAPSS
jgi:anthraniloyl-CoA monooxygenase